MGTRSRPPRRWHAPAPAAGTRLPPAHSTSQAGSPPRPTARPAQAIIAALLPVAALPLLMPSRFRAAAYSAAHPGVTTHFVQPGEALLGAQRRNLGLGNSSIGRLLDGLATEAALAARGLYLLALFAPAVLGAPFVFYLGVARQQWMQLLVWTLERAGPAFLKVGRPVGGGAARLVGGVGGMAGRRAGRARGVWVRVRGGVCAPPQQQPAHRNPRCRLQWGQWASTRPDLFPRDLCQQLSRLQSSAPSHDGGFSIAAVEAAFGRPLGEVFSYFERDPIASGSIAQIHRARLSVAAASQAGAKAGMEVAVKVRCRAPAPACAPPPPRPTPTTGPWVRRGMPGYCPHVAAPGARSPSRCCRWLPGALCGARAPPARRPRARAAPQLPHSFRPPSPQVRHPGVSHLMELDFELMQRAARLSARVPGLSQLRLDESIRQFGGPLHDQLDLRKEALHLARFRTNFRRWRSVQFPSPIYPLVASDVLVRGGGRRRARGWRGASCCALHAPASPAGCAAHPSSWMLVDMGATAGPGWQAQQQRRCVRRPAAGGDV